MEIKVLILTPLPLEYEAASSFLTGDRYNKFKGSANYEHGRFMGKNFEYSVVICEPGMKNIDMALATEKAIQYFKPHIAMLVGIAGGVKDVKIGDVVIAKKAYGYESGKEDIDGYKSRPLVEPFSGELLARAQALSRRSEWKKRLVDEGPEAQVFLGPIAAGDKVIASTDNPTFQRLKLHFNDTLALEMEAIGFALALQEHRDIHGAVIRGISDLCTEKTETDKQNWQPIAAQRAAAFAFELLWQLDNNLLKDSEPTAGLKKDDPIYIRPPLPPMQGMKKQIESHLKKGEIVSAIDLLSEIHADALLFMAEYKRARKNYSLGLISPNDWDIKCNNIVKKILGMIKELKIS